MDPTTSSNAYPARHALPAVNETAPSTIYPAGEPAANRNDRSISAYPPGWTASHAGHAQSVVATGVGRNAPVLGVPTVASTSPTTGRTTESVLAGIIGPGTIGFPRSYQIAKRFLDIVGAATGLIILAPVFLIVALLILLDSSGPVFFIQERVGFRGRPFRMLKFRTMTTGERLPPDGGPHKRRDDHRVTRVGKFLRATSLDEVPQLVNVLRGEMSLVGPRPEILSIVLGKYEPWQYQRFLVPQGMTGWWQVTGRGRKLLYEHTEDDLYYIQHASFWFDLKILLMTIRAVIRREGAF